MADVPLIVRFGANLTGLQAGLNRATSMVQASANRLSSALTSSAVPALAAALAPAAITAAIKKQIEAIDELDKAAQRLGVNGAVQLSGFRRAALEAGVGAEEFDSALTKLNVKLSEAAAGNKQAAALFEALGVSTKTASGDVRDAGDVLKDVFDAFSRLGDSPAKAALAIDFFGRAGARLIPLMNQGGEALNRFTGLTQETVNEAKKAQQEFERWGANVEELKNRFAGGVLPAINTFIDRVKALNTELLKTAFLDGGKLGFFLEFDRQLKSAEARQRQLNEALKLGEGAYSNEGRAALQSAQAIRNAADAAAKLATEQEAARKKAEQFVESLRRRADISTLGEMQTLRWEAAQLGVAKAAEKYISVIERAKALQEELARSAQEWERRQRAINEREGYTRDLNDRIASLSAERDLLGKTEAEQRKLNAAREIDLAFRERVRNLPEDDVAGVTAAFDEAQAAKARASREIDLTLIQRTGVELETLLRSIEAESAAIGKTYAERQRSMLLRQLESSGIDQQSEAYLRLRERIDEITGALQRQEEMSATQARMDELADSVAGLVGEFTRTGDINAFFQNLFRRLQDLLVQMLIIEPLAKSLRMAFSGGGIGAMGFTAAGSFAGLATGGTAYKGKPVLVGERGPELMIPGVTSAIVPNNRIGGNSVSVVQNIQIDSRADQASIRQAMEATRLRTLNDIREMNRRNDPRLN